MAHLGALIRMYIMTIKIIIEQALDRLNLACVIDHSGRAGNAFFLTTFDQHPEILACPLLHYSYSYLISTFKQTNIPADEARTFLKQTSYFRLLCQPQEKENKALIYRMGTDDQVTIESDKMNQLVDDYFKNKQQITRRELALLPFIFYAIAHGRNLAKFKYVLVSDAISLRDENVHTGYSGRVIDEIVSDFPQAKLIHLVRDPRATFASPRHQYVNWLGNMYALRFGNFFSRLSALWQKRLTMDNGCVYLFWLLYLAQSAKTIARKKKQYASHFITIKNEDLNTNFYPTVLSICEWMQTTLAPNWEQQPFIPTILGYPWHGTGAYNSRYQTVTDGLLKNESSQVSKTIAGPNTYVTQRWRKRLKKNEIILLESLFREELAFYKYPFLYNRQGKTAARLALLPFEGELPMPGWIKQGFQTSLKEGLQRVFYGFAFVPFYISSRIVLLDYVFRKKFFRELVLDTTK